MAEHVERMGRRIRERRDELDLTQGQLARLLSGNPDAAQVSRWERGTHEPTPDRKEDIAAALKTTVADLTAGPVAERAETPTETPDMIGSMNGDTNDLEARLSALEADTAAIKTAVGQVLSNWQDELLPILGELHEFVEQQQAAQTSGAKRPSTGRRRQAS